MTTLTPEQAALLPTEQDVAFYQQHGWWISPPLLTEDEIDEARFGVERYYAGERDSQLLLDVGTDWTETRGDGLRQNDYVSLQIEQLRTLAHHPLVAATAARLASTPNVRLFHDQLIYKPPHPNRTDTAVGWHTDIAYWKTSSSRNLITAWIPFQPVTAEMGPMTVLDGSHRWPGNEQLEFFHRSDLDAVAAQIRTDGSQPQEVPLLLGAGQVSFHHCCTIHGSRPNHSNRPRLAIAVHMQDAENRYRAATNEEGNPLSHINDFLCRHGADDKPDYSDPAICPVLWSE